MLDEIRYSDERETVPVGNVHNYTGQTEPYYDGEDKSPKEGNTIFILHLVLFFRCEHQKFESSLEGKPI